MGDWEMADRLPTQRISLCAYWLTRGEVLTVRDLADRLEMTPRGARMLLHKMSLSLPIYDDDGVWRISSTTAEQGNGNG